MSGTHGVFQHRSGYFYTILEEDFCDLYKADKVNEVCRAYITSILETLTNKQYEASECEEDIWVYMSIPEMARRMRNACSERTIHKELQGMIADGYLEKRRAVGKATMEYKLNIKKIRDALVALPEKQPCNSATYHLANLQEPSCKSATLTLQNSKNDLADLQPRISNRITIEETKSNRDTNAQSATAIAPRAPESKPVQISDAAKPEKTTPKRARKSQTAEADDIPVEALAIMADWDSLFKRPCPHTPDHIAAAKLLMICHPTKDDLKAVRAFIYKTNPEWYRDKGVRLSDIAKYFGKWQCQQEQEVEVKNMPPPTVSGRRRLIVPAEALAAMAAGGGR